MKKGGFLRNVLDTIRQPNQPAGSGPAPDCGGQLQPQHFALGQVARHGFPARPSALAFDPVQRLAAVGTEGGTLRVFGRPGVDAWARQPAAHQSPPPAITQLRFVVNQGALIALTSDEALHLWSLRGSQLGLQFSQHSGSTGAGSPQVTGATSAPQTSSSDTEFLTYNGCSVVGSPEMRPAEGLSADADNRKQLEIICTLRFKREHVTCLHQAPASRWLYVGTERGNVLVVNVETFQLSGYSIAWNKAIELARKTHPGPVVHLAECPQDTNKLLIGYQSGCIVLWDLKGRGATARYFHQDSLLGLSWLYDGKQFVAAHANGALITWQTRSPGHPSQVLFPHTTKRPATGNCASHKEEEAAHESCGPIPRVEWRSSVRNNNESLLIFSGGLPVGGGGGDDDAENQRPSSLTIMLGKSITVLDLERPIVDFLVVCEGSPHDNEASEPSAAFVLLDSHLLVIDLQTNGYPSFRCPYSAANLTESPVTCIHFLPADSGQLVALLCSSGQLDALLVPPVQQQPAGGSGGGGGHKRAFSERDWPIAGGELDAASSGRLLQGQQPELVITGHADGSVKFWDMSGLNMDLLGQVRSASLFEEPNWPTARGGGLGELSAGEEPHEDGLAQLPVQSPFAVSCLEFCPRSSRLLLAGALGQVVQLRLIDQRKEAASAVGAAKGQEVAPVILVEPTTSSSRQPTEANQSQTAQTPGNRGPPAAGMRSRRPLVLKVRRTAGQQQQHQQPGSHAAARSFGAPSAGRARQTSGFQPELVCLSPLTASPNANSFRAPPQVTALAYEPVNSILAYAHEEGVALVDVIQRSLIISASLADLYGGGSLIERDISIQPFATSSILQQHYHQAAADSTATLPLSLSSNASTPTSTATGSRCQTPSRGAGPCTNNGPNDNNSNTHNNRPQSAQSGCVTGAAESGANQRQLSTTALRGGEQQVQQPAAGSRLIQRQMTASQLLSHDSPSNRQRAAALLAAARGQPGGLETALASSTSCLSSSPASMAASRSPRRPGIESEDQKKLAGPQQHKGKRIISRMLSISTIHSFQGGGSHDSSSSLAGSYDTFSGTANYSNTVNQQDSSDKIDSSFTRSRSSSCSSDTSPQAQAGQRQQSGPQLSRAESIQCLCFLDWTPDSMQQQQSVAAGPTNNKSLGSTDGGSLLARRLALWLGTSQGSVLLLGLSMPDNDDNRILQLESVEAEPIPQAAIKLRGSIRCLSTFTSDLARPSSASAPGAHSSFSTTTSNHQHSTSSSLEASDSLSGSFESRRSPALNASAARHRHPPQQQLQSTASGSTQPASLSSTSDSPRQPTFLAIVAERQAKIYQVPDGGLAKLLVSEASCVAQANFPAPVQSASLVQMRQPAETCVATQLIAPNNSSGHTQLQVYSLPQLKMLANESQLELSPAHGTRVVFGHNGLALCRPTPSEIAKFTLSAQYKTQLAHISSHLYVAREMPEVPRSNFFKSLLGSVGTSLTSKQCDRDELFGTSATADSSRSLAKNMNQATIGLDRLRSTATGGLASELRMAREGLDERGEKLSEIEDQTLRMMNQSETYSQTSHQLAQKFKDKKWYQF